MRGTCWQWILIGRLFDGVSSLLFARSREHDRGCWLGSADNRHADELSHRLRPARHGTRANHKRTSPSHACANAGTRGACGNHQFDSPTSGKRHASSGTLPTESVAVDAPAAAVQRSDIPHDLSPVGMFMAADWVVKSVMIALGLASVATWTILLVKTLQLSGSKARLRRGLAVLQEARSLSQAAGALQKRRGTVPDMLLIAARELKLSEPALDYAGNDGVKERVSSALSRIESRAGRRMTAGTGILATIGSIGPFVGLFGTVWGIMNSFIGISQSQTTNLAVVAPGIAEALLATAIGLVAAIPAVVIYNVFARAVTGYRQQLLDAATAVERLVSRDLDFRKVPADVRAARLKVVTE